MFLMGIYTAFGKYYRFAAADAADVSFRAKAISFTLAGGLLGGIVGPEVAKHSTGAVAGYEHLGTYLSVIVVAMLALLLLTRLDIPMLSEKERKDPGRPLAEIMRQPVFIVAAMAGMLSYGIMNLMMTSTPLAMRAHDHHFNDAAFVLQWHMIGMYAPSFFTGSLIQRFGVVTDHTRRHRDQPRLHARGARGDGAHQLLGCDVPARSGLELHVRRRLGAPHRVPHARPSARRRRRRTTS